MQASIEEIISKNNDNVWSKAFTDKVCLHMYKRHVWAKKLVWNGTRQLINSEMAAIQKPRLKMEISKHKVIN